MTISVIIANYGTDEWRILAEERALRSLTGFTEEDSFVLYHMDGGTRALSLNIAAEKAPGDHLIFLDADDELAPGYLGAMRRAVEQNTSDGTRVLLTPACQWIRKGRPGPPSFQKEVPLEKGNWLVIGTLISRELFTEIGGFHEHPHGLEDWNLWARAVRAGATIVKVPDAVYIAHVNPQSKHRVLFRANRKGYWDAYEKARVDAWG
jgi:GT2 family glycosyltransferase